MSIHPSNIELFTVSLYLRDNYFSIQKELKFSSEEFLKFKNFFGRPDNIAKEIFLSNYDKFLEMDNSIDLGKVVEIREINQSVLSVPFQKLNNTLIGNDKFAIYFSFKRNKNILIRLGPPNDSNTSIQANIEAWQEIPDPYFKRIIAELLERYKKNLKPIIVKFDVSIEFTNNQNVIKIIKTEEDMRDEDRIFNMEVVERIKDKCINLMENDDLPSESDLKIYYNTFRQKFGPEILSQLDGVELLEKLHDLQDPESLSYWLEYKNDEEFPAIFGGISGGSALKYRIYRRKETGKWMTGSSRSQYEISEEEAIEYAREHRDQFIKGCEILEKVPVDPLQKDYRKLQDDMDEKVPVISRLVWGRKYFSLIFSDKLDDFHSPEFQRTRLIQIHIEPELGEGRYINSWFFIKLKKVLNLPMNHITSTLNMMFEAPYNYWIFQIQNLEEKEVFLKYIKENECLSIPIPESGDLNQFDFSSLRTAKEKILKYLIPRYKGTFKPEIATKNLIYFKKKIKPNDLILLADLTKIKGIGKINYDSEYEFNENEGRFAHQIKMSWIDFSEWNLMNLDTGEELLFELKDVDSLIEIEKYIFNMGNIIIEPPLPDRGIEIEELAPISNKIKKSLERKSQIILYGPPGTGKTYWAEKTACELVSQELYKKSFKYLNDDQKKIIINDYDESSGTLNKGFVRICCFHPSYGYEEFIEGYRPNINENNELVFKLEKGIFYEICENAKNDKGHKYYLIIDEINRGDIPRIFGEIMMIMENNKRNKPILTASGNILVVPENLFVIATMNTADRSIALLDLALRRRFGFIELMPNSNLFQGINLDGFHLKSWFEAINSEIIKQFGVDGRNLQIGHSFFMNKGEVIKNFSNLLRILKEEIFPLLEEFCYDNISLLKNFIDANYIDDNSKSINWEKFENTDKNELIRALLSPFPDLITRKDAVKIDTEETEIEDIDAQSS